MYTTGWFLDLLGESYCSSIKGSSKDTCLNAKTDLNKFKIHLVECTNNTCDVLMSGFKIIAYMDLITATCVQLILFKSALEMKQHRWRSTNTEIR